MNDKPAQRLAKARCSLRGGHFALVFVRTSGEQWLAQRGYIIPPAAAEKGYQPTLLSGIGLSADYSGCPHCQNKSVFVCRNCNTINCQGSAKPQGEKILIRCAGCQTQGFLEGTVTKLQGFGDL